MKEDIMFEESIIEGRESEEKFYQLAQMRGFLVKPATGMEQFDHIDFHLTSEEDEGTMTAMVDVKSRKRIDRSDNDFNDEWVWIEFKNVRGKEGWIHGIADFIGGASPLANLSEQQKFGVRTGIPFYSLFEE